jgi:hypothetical protein
MASKARDDLLHYASTVRYVFGVPLLPAIGGIKSGADDKQGSAKTLATSPAEYRPGYPMGGPTMSEECDALYD